MSKYFSCFIFFLPLIIHGQDENYQTLDCNCKLYKAYTEGKMELWPRYIQDMEKRYIATQMDYCLFQLTFAHFGYTGYLISKNRNDEATSQLKKTEYYVNLLIKRKAYLSRTEALKGSLKALRIALQPSTATIYARSSQHHIHKAIEIDSTCPYGWVEHGVFTYHMPKIFGGSYKTAAMHFEKALRYFEKDKSMLVCNWYYLNTHLWLIKSYEQQGKHTEAKKIYQKLRKTEPALKLDISGLE